MPASAGAIRAGRAFVELFTDNTKLVRGLRQAQAKIRAFGRRISAMGRIMMTAGAAMLAPLLAATKVFSSVGDEVAKMSKRTGVGVEALSALRYVASQTGTNFQTLENAFRKMQRSIYDAGRGLSTQIDALKDLNLTFKDLDGLAPEDQFKLLADRISQIEDPTKRAGIAMSLFGRTGTNLLPMFAAGAKGIDTLIEKARKLNLIITREDAKAAEDFTDVLDTLWKTVQVGVFRVGAALAPVLSDLAQRFINITSKAGKWIQTNQGVIVSALKISAAVVAGGLALLVLGKIIGGVAVAFGVLRAALTVAFTTFKVLGAAMSFIVSPIGLVVAALATLGAYLVVTSGAGGKALKWLGDRFGTLKDDAATAYQGIADALATGDIGLAMKILWLTLKVAWTSGINYLKEKWLDFKFWFLNVWNDIKQRVRPVWETVQNKIAVALVEGKAGLERFGEKVLGVFGLDTEGSSAAIEKQRLGEREVLAKRTEDAHTGIAKKGGEERVKIAKDNAEAIADLEKKLAAARKTREEWQAAIATARAKREAGAVAGGPEAPPGMPDVGDVGAALSRAGAVGTFYAAAVPGLVAGDAAMLRTASATERTARNTDTLVRRGGPTFT